MRNAGQMGQANSHPMYEASLPPEGRMMMMLGVIALILGFGALAAGAYISFYAGFRTISLPGGLSAAGSIAGVFLAGSGALTTLLGGVSIYKSQEM